MTIRYDEKKLSLRLRKEWPRNGAGFIQTFEKGSLPGTPDLFVQHPQKGAFWIELKQVERPSDFVPYREAQPQWIRRNSNAGGRTFTLVIVHQDWKDERLWIINPPCGAHFRLPLHVLRGVVPTLDLRARGVSIAETLLKVS